METHDEDLVVICDRERLFGQPIDDLAEEIREEIDGEKLTLEEHPNGTERVERHGWLVQHSLWLIHCDQLFDAEHSGQLDQYLTTLSIPRQTDVYVCIEDRGDEARQTLEETYRDRIEVITDKKVLVAKASTYLNMVNPARGTAGKMAIKGWNNAVCTLLEDFGGVNHG